MSNNSQAAQAVTNTLAGEKLVQTVIFPLTGDAEMDFIGGLLSVWEGLPLPPDAALRAAEYFRHRVAAAAKEREDSLKQLAQKQTEEAWLEKKRQELLSRMQGSPNPPVSAPGQLLGQPFTTGGMSGIFYPQEQLISKWDAPNQTPGLSHPPPPLYQAPPDGTVPLPHPPQFASAIQAREQQRLVDQTVAIRAQEIERLLQIKAMDTLDAPPAMPQ